MHIEFLVEDTSGKLLLEIMVPKIIGPHAAPHTWRITGYSGIGRLPTNLNSTADPRKRQLLDRLPSLLRGFGKTAGIDAVVVLCDSDKRDCRVFLAELLALVAAVQPKPKALLRLAIEEMEAWYLGDTQAIRLAYPRAKTAKLNSYVQDSICETWETLADAVHAGGIKAVRKAGWPLPGQLKCEWARAIGPHLDPMQNASPSFGKFRDGLLRLVSLDARQS